MNAPRPAARDLDGILLYDKPAGRSSNAALQDLKRLYRARKAGHTGSLDPLASGVLAVCFGQATKLSGFMLAADKHYTAVLLLGLKTTSGDAEGAVVEEAGVPALEPERIAAAVASLTGSIEQVPPMHSALRRDGARLYALARQGRTVERPARPVTIHALRVIGLEREAERARLTFSVHCSKGTYIRTLGESLAAALGTVGYLTALHRTAIAPFESEPVYGDAELAALAAADRLDAALLPADAALRSWPRVDLDARSARAFAHGQSIALTEEAATGRVRVYAGGRLLAIASADRTLGQISPLRLLVPVSAATGG